MTLLCSCTKTKVGNTDREKKIGEHKLSWNMSYFEAYFIQGKKKERKKNTLWRVISSNRQTRDKYSNIQIVKWNNQLTSLKI